jgi:hypothetical protein
MDRSERVILSVSERNPCSLAKVNQLLFKIKNVEFGNRPFKIESTDLN